MGLKRENIGLKDQLYLILSKRHEKSSGDMPLLIHTLGNGLKAALHVLLLLLV